MAKIFDKADIVSLNLIRPGHVSQSVDAFTGAEAYDVTLSGSFTLTGSLKLNNLSSSTPIVTLGLTSDGVVVTSSYVPSSSILWETGSAGTYSIKPINDSPSDATADYALSMGYNTLASGDVSIATGYNTTASGPYSHAEGESTLASGDISHAEGHYTIASGDTSHAEGRYTIASGYASHAEGQYTRAIGNYSHAEGYFTTSSGVSSHAEGQYVTASGDQSHAEGYVAWAKGTRSHAEGSYTIASGSISHAEGYVTIASGDYSHAEGRSTEASGLHAHAEGFGSEAGGNTSHAEGKNTIANGDYSHAEGDASSAPGYNSHAEGYFTIASGSWSHSQGYRTTASGSYSHAGGLLSKAEGIGSFIHSSESIVTGDNSAVIGGIGITGSADNTVYTPNLITTGSLTVGGASAINTIVRRTYTFTTTDATPYVQSFTAGVQFGRYIKAIVIGNSAGNGSLGGEFVKFYDYSVPTATQLSSTGTLADNIGAGTPTFAISDVDEFTATGIAATTIDWKVILEYADQA